jgi:hypothetical protein
MPIHEHIAVAAYYLWLNHGKQDATTNWLAAEAHLLSEIPAFHEPASPSGTVEVSASPHVTF